MPPPPRNARLALLPALALLLSSCGSRGTILVYLDEAFAAARPDLARELEAGPGPFSGYRVETRRLKLSESPGAALEALDSLRADGGKPVALVASPLLAAALPGPWRLPGTEESSIGELLLLAPEWRGGAAGPELGQASPSGRGPSFARAASDPRPAYAAAGAAAGAYIASLGSRGGAPSGAILFREAPSRPRAALEAFASAFEGASGGLRPLVRELPPSEEADSEAEAAVRELLEADIRFLFVALGEGRSAAIRAAARPGLALGADDPGPEDRPGLAFRLRPDDRGIAASLWSALPGAGNGPRKEDIGSRIEAAAGARNPEARAFSPFLRGLGGS